MGLVKFIVKTSAEYAALQSKDNDAIYFISDTHKMYKGSVEYCAQGSSPESGTLVLKGTLNAGGSTTIEVPTEYRKGNVYIVAKGGNFMGKECRGGEMVVAVADYSAQAKSEDWKIYREVTYIHETVWE